MIKSSKDKYDISVIILNYNAKPFLSDCFSSIQMQKDLNIQVIMVDNKSTDDSVEYVKNNFPHVEIIRRNTPVGFSAGNNRGVNIAEAKTILFLNPDMKFRKADDLKKIVDKYYKINRIGVLSCKVLLVANGKVDITSHRGFPTPWAALTYFIGLAKIFPKSKLFAQYLQSYKGYDTAHEVDSVGGMFMLMDKQVGEEVGWWDEDYPLYGEDIDFCYRIKKSGYKVFYWPYVTVEHYKGASTGRSKSSKSVTTASKDTLKRVKGWSILAMEVFYRKHYLHKYPFFINWIVLFGIKLLKFKRVTLT